MECNCGGVRLRFTFGFFAVIALAVLVDRVGMGLAALAAIGLHECGHLLAMRLCGAKPERMSFEPFGLRLVQRGLLGYGQEAAVYLGGVAMNALCLLLAWPWEGLRAFAFCSAALFCFNLLPLGRLDGGRLLCALLARQLGPQSARTVMRVTGMLLLLPLFAAGLALARMGNFTLLLTCCYLAATLADE